MDERSATGRMGEQLARQFLVNEGYTIRHTNWRIGHKELDIVAQKAKVLHVVEVRTRTVPVLVAPAMTVDRKKQRLILSAANAYVKRYKWDMDVRFDIVAIVFSKQTSSGITKLDWTLEFIPDAFSIFV